MTGYLNAQGQLDKAGRRVERSILEFVFRAACKTSPFSTLASIGFGEFASGGPAELVPAPISVTKHSRIRLNMAVLARISRLITAADHLRGDPPVTMTSSWKVKLEQPRDVRRRAGGGEAGRARGLLGRDRASPRDPQGTPAPDHRAHRRTLG